jgi:hypothetical protein
MASEEEPELEDVVRLAVADPAKLARILRDMQRRLRDAERELARLRERSYRLIV